MRQLAQVFHNLAVPIELWGPLIQASSMMEPKQQLLVQLTALMSLSLTALPPISNGIPAGDWELPVVGAALVNSYRQSETPYSEGHRGVDFAVNLGHGVFSPANGTVHFVGRVVDRQLISIRHDGNLLSAFEPVCSLLQVGQSVSTGDLLGEVCEPESNYQSHCPNQTCLHFSARFNGEYLSPLWLTGDLPPARLLPWIEP